MKTALVVGRAKSVWDEVSAARALGKIDYVLVTGPIAVDFPGPVDAWVWFHTELFPDYAAKRAKAGHPPVRTYWGPSYRGKIYAKTIATIPLSYTRWDRGGSSGMIATQIALNDFGSGRVILAGVPMTADGGQYDSSKKWDEAVKHQHAWQTALPQLQGKVRSFSGWTLDLLGGQVPTTEWLRGEEDRVAA